MPAPGKKINKGPKKKARDEFQEDEIFQAPVITREPSSRQAKLGSKVTLRVQASGKPLPSFQWFHNGKKIVGQTMDRLTLSKVRRQAAGAYHCEAKNFVGKAVSRVCMLSFFTQKVPKLEISPAKVKLEEGKPFTLKITSCTEEDLKEFTVYWIFNGMRIKGAQGLELNISAVKKKYEGEYKAMISVGSGIETSNAAKLVVVPAKAKKAKPKAADAANAAPEPEAPLAEEPQTLDDILAREPTKALESAPKVNWDEFNFNPEDEEPEMPLAEEPSRSLVAPAPGSESFGNTSPGTPGAPKAPLSQLATEDLILQVAARGGVSELLEETAMEDPSSLISAAELTDGPQYVTENPSALIEMMESRAEPPKAPAPKPLELPSRASAVKAEAHDDADALIADWDAPVKPLPRKAASSASAPDPLSLVRAKKAEQAETRRAPKAGLARKKEFLERFLARWQKNTGPRRQAA